MFIGIDPDLALRIVREAKVMAYDTETTGLDYNSVICGYVFTASEWGSVYVPVRHGGGGNIPNVDAFETELRAAFNDRGRIGYRTVGHNLAFDFKMSAKHGVMLPAPLEDTMINEGLIYDIAPGFGLDDCAERYGVTPKRGHDLYVAIANLFGGLPDRKQMGNYWKLAGDNPLAVDYSCGDGISTLELWEKQQAKLDELSLRRVWQLECDLIPHLGRMNHRGIKVDHDYAERVKDVIAEKIAEAKKILPAGFNVRSPKEVEALYRSQGVTDFAKTAQKKPSFTEKWLETNEIGRAILGVRRLEKANDSFIAPLVSTNNRAGRVHPVLNQSKSDEYGAVGGRFSCSEPNLQAFPKRNKQVGQVVRPLLIPDMEFIYEADFSQQEPRLFAHYSGDENLIRGYTSNPVVDLHDNTNTLMGLHERDFAKRMGMGILTGMQKNSLAGHLGIDVDLAARYLRKFLDAYPGIEKFQSDAKSVFKRRGNVKTILGRIANLDEQKYAYRAVSRIIQGSGADHTKTVFLRILQFAEAYSELIEILLTIHDSFIWQANVPSSHPLIREMVRLMEDVQSPPFNFIVPIPVEVMCGKNWADASYGKKFKTANGWVN